MGEIIASATPEITENLHKLLSGQNITAYIDTSVICPEVQTNPYSIYSLLLVAGYLRVSAIYPQHDGNFMCDVGIPNKEIAYVYEKEVLNKTNQNSIAISQAVFSENTDRLQMILVFMALGITGCRGTDKKGTNMETKAEVITAKQAKEIMEQNTECVILDVREQSEYEEGHIAGAILIPYTEIKNRKEELPDKDQLILIYCRSGRRSAIAAASLIEMGYTNVKDFGGIIDWPYEIVKD